MKKFLLLCSAVVFAFSSAWAQERTVSGRVSSTEDGSSLPGVNVLIKGTTNGTVTDADGNYKLSVPSANSALVFSFIGLQTQEVPIGERSVVDVSLALDVTQLSEVVVVGYGMQEKKSLTGSLSSIDGKSISSLPAPSFDTQLAGRASGLQIQVPSGAIGVAPRIRIRGTNSISSGATPLIVVDNVPIITGNQSSIFSTNPLADINPADIESFEVLKDGSATAIYGSRAANGVILITTKRGKEGKASLQYDSYFGVNEAVNRFDLLNAAEFVEINNEKYTNRGQPIQAVLGTEETDWQEEVLRTGVVQNHNISLSGGANKTSYFFSLGWLNNESALLGNSYERYSFRANVDQQVFDKLKIGTSISYSNATTEGLNTGGNALSGNIAAAIRLLPNVAARDPLNSAFDGFNVSPNGAALGQGPNLRLVDNNYSNIAFVLDRNKYFDYSKRIQANAYADLEIIEGLTARTQIAVDLLNNEGFQSLDPRHGDGRGRNGYVAQVNRNVDRWNWQSYLTFNRTLAEVHTINLVAGIEYQKTKVRSFTAEGTDFSIRFFQATNLITDTYASQFSSGTATSNGFESYFGRANYSFKDKYLVSATLRSDAISSLPETNRRGLFPGASIGWRLSEESFIKESSFLEFLSEFKLRASYAQVGNVDIGNFPYAGTFGAAQYGSLIGIAFNNTQNLDLKWESSRKTNFGIDLGFLQNRITLNADYFINDVDDLVLDAPTPASFGIPSNFVTQNIGSLTNKGIELSIAARAMQTENFTWNITFNYTGLKNEVTALLNNADVIYDRHILRVGEQIGSFYGFDYVGVNPSNGNPLYRKANGSIVQGNIPTSNYRVYDPNNPSDISQAAVLSSTEDRRVLGISNPKWFGALINNFSFKGFDLEVFLRYSGGNKLFNATRQDLLNQGFQNNGREILNRWTTDGQITDVPKLWSGNESFVNLTTFATTRFLEDADFLRVQNITLGYKIPSDILADLTENTVKSVRVFAQVQNPFVFTNYSGLDPELSTTSTDNAVSNTRFGVDSGTSPIMRTISFGINIGL